MIFAKLFKKPWQHKDSAVRVEAISNSLSLGEPEHRFIIEQLAKNDEHENVRRAALIKLADFQTWLLHSQENSMEKVRRYAEQKVSAILTDQDEITLSMQEKLSYIAAHQHYHRFELWLKSTQDPTLVIALFEKLAEKPQPDNSKPVLKPQLLINLFAQKQHAKVQAYIVAKLNDIASLEKLKKKACNEQITQQITEKLTQLQAVIERPINLRKQVNLVLAKLQALKEQSDFVVYQQKRELLIQEWQTLNDKFAVFDSTEQNRFSQKYCKILTQLEQLFASKAEQHAQAEIAQALAQQKQHAIAHFQGVLQEIDQALSTSIFENERIDEQQYLAVFKQLAQEIADSPLSLKQQEDLQGKVAQQQQKLQQLPLIAESVAEATQLISKVSQLALPTTLIEMNERLPIYQQWLSDWQAAEKKSAGALPESIKSAAQEIEKNWQSALKPLQTAQKQEFSVTQKKLSATRRLIAAGKFNAAFGVFKKAKQLFNALSEQQQQRLQKDYHSLNEKIAELADWEHYIATPRKQKLLTDIQAIVDTPLDNPNEQAEKVKQYRKLWNSLGHAEDDAEQALNTQFNALCETAFAPCRVYFAEQEKLREQHLGLRRQLVSQAQELADGLAVNDAENTVIDHKQLAHSYHDLIKQWQQAGQVDRSVYQAINTEFNAILAPVKSLVYGFYQENKTAKQTLITSAEALLSNEDIYAAINQVKNLQAQWRELGYAGAKYENKLWQKFRKINDQIFAKRAQQTAKEEALLLAKTAELTAKFDQLLEQFSVAKQLDELQAFAQQLQTLASDVSAQKPAMVALEKQISAKKSELTKKITQAKQAGEKQQWQLVFALLSASAVNGQCVTAQNQFLQLNAFWQKKLKELASKNSLVSRDQATIALEVLAGIPSPVELQQQRMAVQVELMQSRMSSGADIDLTKEFNQWLLLGKLSEQDLPLLERIKPIFL
ncbi:protein of unknown function [Colwellia chukchiensis]|uniref:DUF349 domain-containing protein n=1 Tax=Colwellia chukchiensis TaxID=641665 RepID=A0A1H7MW62_9GAMM|nr:DUF349 domain-containing protein [Colwellia chukchiensis]SEL15028.1 protein of unknown function [Colwellia chukchiensis]